MQRRNFMQKSVLAAGASLLMGAGLNANPVKKGEAKKEEDLYAGKPFNLNYGIHDGMFHENAGESFIDQLKWAYDIGFRSMEDNGMSGRPPAEQSKIGEAMARLGMTMGVFVLEKGGNDANSLTTGKPEYVEIFLKGCRDAVEVSKRCGNKLTTVVPGDFDRNLPIGIQTSHVIDALRRGAEILEPHGVVMVLEPLSDDPDLFLRTSDQTHMICKAVNSPSCKILFDMYHMQRNEGDLINNIDLCYDQIGYFQIGNNPGRNEPGTGEMDYKNIFKHIYGKGYRGILGMEHGTAGAGKAGELALIKAYRDADNFL